MKENTLITILGEHNESGIILANKYDFKEVIIIADKEDESKSLKLKESYLNKNNKLKVDIVFKDFEDYIFNNDKNKLVINLTLDNTLKALKLLNLCNAINNYGVYVDIIGKKEYWFNNDMKVLKEEPIDLDIDDMFEASGNNIIAHECKYKKDKYILEFAKEIYNNLELWHKYKQRLYDNRIFEHDIENSTLIHINKDILNNEEKDLLSRILRKLEEFKLIEIEEDMKIHVRFLNEYLKGFIFKSGTWLEVLTESIVEEISSVDEVKSGVVFLWDSKHNNIKNELDVVAVKDSTIVCISCKDSAKYDENALNELEVYSNKIGGANARKILVATKQPLKSSVKDRAREMDIHLVIVDNDINIFKKTLEKIINK
ncbi:MAG: DUF1887 family protein [Clostridium baratii]|uniref:Card1 endonuclease domain-containing protein n=1 Tax=Clostridium baratii str. Sullivan TaxID=1415775 RepID=A0A0A7FUB4_9CLOT|nr:DUF1887 family CARF protein [Clostridium baratii]AIY83209.1 hypothetical protein U729_1139 [Clostridium baratii str. Sullivan]MBS6007768.1 DUF1887 family protein [Clostridium baratii]MDU1054561.1 DUF1887 family CARF protein [Clostridium baratii]MDU4911352.1 DUF1887 family CARF protein [Clostridium baratii]